MHDRFTYFEPTEGDQADDDIHAWSSFDRDYAADKDAKYRRRSLMVNIHEGSERVTLYGYQMDALAAAWIEWRKTHELPQ